MNVDRKKRNSSADERGHKIRTCRRNSFGARLRLSHAILSGASSLVLQRRFLNLVRHWPEITPRKATKLSSMWAGRHEEVLKVLFL